MGCKKAVQNLPDGFQLFEMIFSIELRNEGYLSAAYAGLMTTQWTVVLKVFLIIIIHKGKPNMQRCIARNVFLAAIKRVLWFGLLEKNGSIAVLQAENDCTRHTGNYSSGKVDVCFTTANFISLCSWKNWEKWR